MSAELDYYQALEIDKNADGETIKKSYRRLAMKYHPDKNPGNKEAEEKFKYLCEAYDCLKDDQKRAAYDRYGHSGYKQSASGGMGGGNPFGFGFGTGDFSDLFSDIFSEFMGGGGRRQSTRTSARRGDDLQYNMSISLEEAYIGLEKEINIGRTKGCEKCGGHGTKDGKEAPVCSSCRGSGRVRVQRGFFVMEEACPHCRGEGRIIKEACSECHGNGYIKKHENIKVSIPAGIDHGSRVRLSGAGNAGLRGGTAGDLYIYINIKDHKIYERDGAHLYAEVPISMGNAALGTKIDLPGIDGEKVEVEIPSGSQYGSKLKIKSKGMPYLKSGNRGDLYILLKIEVPKKMTARQKELLEEFQSIADENSHPDSKSFFDKVKEAFSKVS